MGQDEMACQNSLAIVANFWNEGWKQPQEAEDRVKRVIDLARQHQHPVQCTMEAISTG